MDASIATALGFMQPFAPQSQEPLNNVNLIDTCGLYRYFIG